MFMTRSEISSTPTKNRILFEDCADKYSDEYSPQTKYKQINKNLQGIIAFCANKLGSNHSRGKAPKRAVLADQRIYEENLSEVIIEGDERTRPKKWDHHDSYSETAYERTHLRTKNNGTLYRSRETELKALPRGTFGSDGPVTSEHNLKEFQDLIQNFTQTSNGGSEYSTIPLDRWLQIRRINEFELPMDQDNKIVKRQLKVPDIESGRSFIINKYRNLSSSPFMPLKCPKCQLEISKRELDTIGRKLKLMQGYRDCRDFCCGCCSYESETVAGHFCSGDESGAEWECTCGQNPYRNRELHRQDRRDSNKSLISSQRMSRCESEFLQFPSREIFECRAPNFMRHEDTNGKCRDCYRQDMLQQAFKLKQVIDMQYERHISSIQRDDGTGAHTVFEFPTHMNASGEYERTAEPKYANSDKAMVLELNQSSNSVAAEKSESIIVVDKVGNNIIQYD